MTESEWLTGTDFTAHVQYACECLSLRRQRLLAAGFCRAVEHLFDHPDLANALAVIELAADGVAAPGALESARQRCREIAVEARDAYDAATDRGSGEGLEHSVRSELAWVVARAAAGPMPVPVEKVGRDAAAAAVQARTGTGLMVPVASAEFDAAAFEQSLVMRAVVWEVVGNPFRPVNWNSLWRTDTVLSLARQMYKSRDFSAMPILADALQDAGCDNDDVLNHCRDPRAIHVRGCWVIDCIFGKG
jgi:hypothetical protein